MPIALVQKANLGALQKEKTLKTAKVKRKIRLRFMLFCYLSKER